VKSVGFVRRFLFLEKCSKIDLRAKISDLKLEIQPLIFNLIKFNEKNNL